MNYRHAFHAGNIGDVFKHAVFVRVLEYLSDKPKAFRVIDSHAGAGLYDLAGDEAARTGEWRAGIGRLWQQTIRADTRDLLAPYLAAVAGFNAAGELKRYPGSPLLALKFMRAQDRLTACELEPSAAAALKRHLRTDKRASAVAIDGWKALNAYVPPNERRGVVLIDPSFEDRAEFAQLIAGLTAAHRKWPTGIYLSWYPITSRVPVEDFAKRLRRTGIVKMLRAELRIAPTRNGLNGAGLIIINPPWRLPEDLRRLGPALAEALTDDRGAFTLRWLTSEKAA